MTKLRYSADERKEGNPSDADNGSAASWWGRTKDKLAKAGAAVAVTVAIGGCGAKSGLLVEDMRGDAGARDSADVTETRDVTDTIDMADTTDATDTTDTPDTSDATDTPDTTDTPEVSGVVIAENLIGDYLNRNIGDRDPNIVGNPASEYPIGASDTSENANPFTNGAGGVLGTAPAESFLHKIDGMRFPQFADVTIVDRDGPSYVERQALWLRGNNHFDHDFDGVVGRVALIAYTLKFDGPEIEEAGIPLCTAARDGGDHTACTGWGDEINFFATAAHRVQVKFLGEDWIILRMVAPEGVSLTDENTLANGGMVTLAKEAASDLLTPGGPGIEYDGLTFANEGLEVHDGRSCSIITVLGTGDPEDPRNVICPTETLYLTIHDTVYPVHVYKVYTALDAQSAEVAILSQELVLTDGQQLDAVHGTNPDFHVSLGWKNLAAATSSSPAPDALRTIIVYSDDIEDIASSGDEVLWPGDSIPLAQNPTGWRLVYDGLDLPEEELEPLTFEIETTDLNIPAARGPLVGSDGSRAACVIYAPYVRVRSGASGSVFSLERSDASGEMSDNEFYIALTGRNDMDPDADTDGPGDDVNGTRWVAAACDAHGDGVPDNSLDSLGGSLTPYVDPTNSVGYAPTAGDGDLGFEPGTIFMKVSPSSADFGVYAYDSYGSLLTGEPATEVGYAAIGEAPLGFAPPNGGVILVEAGSDVVNQPMSAPAENQLGDLFYSVGAQCFLFPDFHAMECGSPLYLSGEREDGTLDRYGRRDNVPDFYFAIAETAGSGRSDRFVNYHIFAVDGSATGNPADATFSFDALESVSGFRLTSSSGEVLYGHATPNSVAYWPYTNEFYGGDPVVVGPVSGGVEFIEPGYISERGSEFSSMRADYVEFLMAHRLAKGRWRLE